MSSPLQLRAATYADLPAACDVLARAFENDPEMAAVVPPPDERVARLTRLFHVQAEHHYLGYGAIDLAFDDGELLGVAMWAAPGFVNPPPLVVARMVPAYIAALGPHTGRAIQAERTAQRFHPRYRHWYLYVIGASPSAQGRGVGKALIARGLDRADERHDACYLEATTPRSASLYRRLGFVDLGAQPSGSTGMWRPASHPQADEQS